MNLEERRKLLSDIKELVGERCHGFVFAGQVDIDEDKNGDGEDFVFTWGGSVTLANGLLNRATRRLKTVDDILNQDAAMDHLESMGYVMDDDGNIVDMNAPEEDDDDQADNGTLGD
jgi:hypothetical protein